jgi:hypothetical protein
VEVLEVAETILVKEGSRQVAVELPHQALTQ